MKAAFRLPRHALWATLLLAGFAGCAAVESRDAPIADVTPQRQQRQQEVAADVETSRDLAELELALSRWNQGDLAGSEETLRRVLARNPNQREARLLLAEACLADGREDEAFQEIELALRNWPDDAQVQFTTALLLEEAGQTNAAVAYYRRAAQLEPKNETYAISYQTALLDARATRPNENVPFEPSDAADAGFAAASDEPQPAVVVAQQRPIAAPTEAPALDVTAEPDRVQPAAHHTPVADDTADRNDNAGDVDQAGYAELSG